MSLNQIPDFMLSDEAGSVKDKIAVLSGAGGAVEKTNKSEFDAYKAETVTISSFPIQVPEIDDTARIQRAINACRTKGGGTVDLLPERYDISASLVLYGYIVLQGQGQKTLLAINGDFPVVTNDGNLPYDERKFIGIENLSIQNTYTTIKTRYEIELVNPFAATISNVFIYANAVSQTDVTLNGVAGIRVYTDNGGGEGGESYCTKIKNCLLSNASILMEQSDSKITSCFVWSQTREYGIYPKAGNITIIDCDIVGSDIHGGIYLTSESKSAKVLACFFDGSYDDVPTGHGIYGYKPLLCTITGNVFWNNKKSGIWLDDAIYNTITGNVFDNNNRSEEGYSEITLNTKTDWAATKNTIVGNTFSGSRTTKGYAIEERYDDGKVAPYENNIIGNSFAPSNWKDNTGIKSFSLVSSQFNSPNILSHGFFDVPFTLDTLNNDTPDRNVNFMPGNWGFTYSPSNNILITGLGISFRTGLTSGSVTYKILKSDGTVLRSEVIAISATDKKMIITFTPIFYEGGGSGGIRVMFSCTGLNANTDISGSLRVISTV